MLVFELTVFVVVEKVVFPDSLLCDEGNAVIEGGCIVVNFEDGFGESVVDFVLEDHCIFDN